MMLANFYYEFSPLAVVIGAVLAAALVLVFGLSGHRALSAALSGVGCGVIAFFVLIAGRGDMIGLVYLVIGVPLAALGGAFAGFGAATLFGSAKVTGATPPPPTAGTASKDQGT